MEYTKKEMLRLIQERHDMDETRADDYVSKGRAESDLIKTEGGVVIGFKQVDYNTGVKIPCLHVCGDESTVQQILTENPTLIEQLKEEFPDTKIRWTKVKSSVACLAYPSRRKSVIAHPLPGEEGEPIDMQTIAPKQKDQSVETTNERLLKDAIVSVLESQDVKDRLEKCSVPPIYSRERGHYDDHNSEFGNRRIFFRTHTVHTYDDAASFIQDTIDKMAGKNVQKKYVESYLRRIYNKVYAKWNETRTHNVGTYGNKASYLGKTPIYNLDKLGYNPKQQTASVMSELEIQGTFDEYSQTYTWNMIFSIKFGDTLKDNPNSRYSLTRKLDLDRSPSANTTVELTGTNTRFNEKYVTLDNRLIYQGLVQCLEELKGKFFTEIKPVQAIRMANVEQDRLMGEQIVNKIVNQILK